MPFIGNTPSVNFTSFAKQDITGVTGSPAKRGFTLTHAVANANEIEVFVNNVRQEPTESYTVNGTGLTMSGDVETTDDFYLIYLGKAIQTTVPPDGSVSTAKIADNAVTTAKIADDAVNLTSKVTGVLPVANGGTGATSLATGKVLQVKQAIDQTQRAVSGGSATSYATWSNSLSVAITPTASTSKLLVSFCTESYNALNSVSLYLTIFRGSTDIGNSSGYGLARGFSSASDINMGMNGVKLDAPETTSEIIYTVRAKLSTGSGPAYFNSQTIGTLTVMEIGG